MGGLDGKAVGGKVVGSNSKVQVNWKGKAPKKHHGILGNLIGDVADTAKGIGPGIWQLGKAAVNDTDQALTGSSAHGSFMFDDIGKSIAKDYGDRYGMLAHGHFKQFGKSISDHPLSYILDAVTLATLGAGAAGTAGELAVEAGTAAAGSRAAKLAGYVERTPAALADAERAYGVASKDVRIGADHGLVKDVRRIGARSADDGLYSRAMVAPAKRNPLLRGRDNVIESALDHPKLRALPGIGSKSRIVRKLQHPVTVAADVRSRALAPALHALSKLDKDELVAWGVKHQGIDPEKYAQTLEATKAKGDLSELDTQLLDARVAKLRDENVQALVEHPTAALDDAVKETQDLSNEHMAPLLQEITGIDDQALLSRRLMPKRITEGATRATAKDVRAAARDGNPDEVKVGDLMDPKTNRPYHAQDAGLDPGELAKEAEGTGYVGHLMPSGPTRDFGTARTSAISRREPGLASNLTKPSTGRRFESGVYEDGPQVLIKQARGVHRGKLSRDLFHTAVNDLSVPFDEGAFLARGGSQHTVLLDTEQMRNLSKTVKNMEGVYGELQQLLPEEQYTKLVKDASEGTSTIFQKVKEGEANPNHVVMVDRQAYQRLTDTLNESSDFAKNVIDKPLDVFRTLVLFSRPGYYVNNIVGQHMLLAIKEQGPMFLPRYVQFLARKNMEGARQVFGEALSNPDIERGLWNPVFDKHFPAGKGAGVGLVESGGSGGMIERMSLSGSRPQRVIAAMLRSPHKANELGAILSDDLPRQFRFARLMDPHIKAARAAGMPGADADVAMKLLNSDSVLRDRITAQTLHDLVDYRGMSSFERKVIRRIIPFYGWMRGITHWTVELGYNHPDQLLELAAVGQVGQNANADWNGQVPEWLQGAIRIGNAKDGKQRVIGTQGLNPLSSIADVATLAQGAFSDRPAASLAGGTTVGQINPFARVLLQSVFNKGKDFSSGMPMLMPGQKMTGNNTQWPGWIGTAAGGFLGSTPQSMLYSQIATARENQRLTGQPSTPGAVYSTPWLEYLRNYGTGLPLRTVNLQGALARRQKDDQTLAGTGGTFG